MRNNPYGNLISEPDWKKFFDSSLRNNGYRLNNDAFVTGSGTVRFVHFSPRAGEVLERGAIAVSGGGLFGVVYVTLLRNNNEVHNLGRYIFETEMSQESKKNCKKCLIFEIEKEDYFCSIKSGALNYIIDSQVYCGCSTLSPESRIFLDGMCDKIKSLLIKLNESSATDFCLWDQVAKYFEDFSFMKHVFFEAINEYLYIKQDNDEALKFAKMGEVYAKNVKNYLFSVSPILKKKFSTEVFETNLRIHIDRLKKEGQKIIKHYDSEDFMQFMQARLFSYLSTMLNEVNYESITGRFVLKNTSSEKRHTVEQCGAEKIWRKADNFSVLHYRTIPKGEWGIMPVSNNIKTYQGQYVDGFIQNIQPIKIKIESRILNNTESVLRIKI